jgi:hypothetical protein
MSRFDAWSIHLSTLLVGGSGLVYAWMLYWLEPTDPYAVVHHPLQPLVQHLHVWLAPLLVFAAGAVWRSHGWAHFKQGMRPRRWSGRGLLLTLAPMVASGYLIQTAVSPGWRQLWVAIHLASSGLWIAAHAAHLISSPRARAAAARRPRGMAPRRSASHQRMQGGRRRARRLPIPPPGPILDGGQTTREEPNP